MKRVKGTFRAFKATPILIFLSLIPLAGESSNSLLPGILPSVSQESGALTVNFAIPNFATESPAPEISLGFEGVGIAGNFGIQGLPSIEMTPDGRFMAEGYGELRQTGSVYRARYDTGTVFEPIGSCSGPCSWRVKTSDGAILIFDTAIESGSRNIIWGLSRVENPNGKYFTIEYEEQGSILYPERIDYTYSALGSADRRIEFHYSDITSTAAQWKFGLRSDHQKLLESISVRVNGDQVYKIRFEHANHFNQNRLETVYTEMEGQQLTRPVKVQYTSAGTGFSRRETTTDTGAGKPDFFLCQLGAAACLATQFSPPVDPLVASGCALYQLKEAAKCETGNTWSVMDYNGDGRADFVSSRHANSGDGRLSVYLDDRNFESPSVRHQNSIPYGMKGSQMPFDINGDGYIDHISLHIVPFTHPTEYRFAVYYGTANGFSESRHEINPAGGFGAGLDADLLLKQLLTILAEQHIGKLQRRKGRWGRQIMNSLGANGGINSQIHRNRAISVALGMVNETGGFMQMADMNGDGLPDFIRLMDNGNLGVSFGTGTGFVGLNESSVMPGKSGNDGFRQLSDFNGDGIMDYFVMIDSGGGSAIAVYTGNTSGHFSYRGAWHVNPGHHDFRTLNDVNGDGLADFVRHVEGQGIWIDFGTGKNFSSTHVSSVNPGHEIGRNLVDVTGDGLPDFVRFIDTGNGSFQLRYSYFTNGRFHGETPLPLTHPNYDELKGRFVFFDDVNADGRVDIIAPDNGRIEAFLSNDTPVNHIQAVTDGKISISVSYGKSLNEITNQNVNTRSGGQNGYSILADTMTRFLVKEIVVSGHTGEKSRSTFAYSDSRMRIGPTHFDSRPLGIRKITERNYVFHSGHWREEPAYTVTTNHHQHPTLGYDGGGLPESVRSYTTAGVLLSENRQEFVRPKGYSYANLIKFTASQETGVDRSTNREFRQERNVTSFDENGNATNIQDIDTETGEITETEIRYNYGISGFPAGIPEETFVRRNEVTISYERRIYDSRGNAISIETGPDANHTVTRSIAYDSDGNAVSESMHGLTTHYQYNKSGGSQPVKVTAPDGSTSNTVYDSYGRKVKEIDANGRELSYSYDSLGRKTTTTISAPGIFSTGRNIESMSYEYDSASGEMTIIADRAAPGDQRMIERTIIDEWGRELRKELVTANGTTVSETTYDEFDRPVARSLPYRGTPVASQTVQYDSLGRTIRTESPGAAGTLVQNINPAHLDRVSFSSMGSGRTIVGFAIQQTKPNGQIIYEYKAGDRPVQTEYQTSVSQNGSAPALMWNRIRYHYDDHDRLIAITRGTGVSRASIADDSRLTTTISYDGFGRKTSVYDPGKGTTHYSYNANHQPLCTEYPDGKVTCNQYDAFGRLIALRENSITGPVLAEFRYSESESAHGQGKLTWTKDDSGEKRIHYDALTGKPAKIERTYEANGRTKQFDIEQAYDVTGALLRRKFVQTDMALYYLYHPEGTLREVQLEDPDNRVIENGSSAIVMSTDPPDALGQSAGVDYGNGVRIDTARNPAGYVTRMTVTAADGKQAEYSYVYNSEGMIIEKKDDLRVKGIDRSEKFTYDIARRLTSAEGPYGDRFNMRRTISYQYGPDGQPVQIDQNQVNYLPNHPHRLKSVGQNSDNVQYRYDTEDGNGRGLVTRRHQSDNIQTEYFYNWQGRISRVRNTTPQGVINANYLYDVQGNRFYRNSEHQGDVIHTYDLASDYRIHSEGNSEYHTIEVQNNGERIARFRFIAYHHMASAPGSSDLYLARAATAIDRMAYFDGGIANLPTLFYIAGENIIAAVRYYDVNQLSLLRLAFYAAGISAAIMLLFAWYRAGWFRTPGKLIHRFTSIGLAITVLSMTSSCVNSGSDQLLIPPGGGGSFIRSGGGTNDSTLVGTFYYISTHNGSTDLVTDSRGKVIARFAYDPFGNIVNELTDLDPDGNKEFYKGTFYFTGQEYEVETGLYNYKARLYDSKTGRFLQPDPVHTDRVGFDNYDRYQYANNNPINFNDPDGKIFFDAGVGGLLFGGAALGLTNTCGKVGTIYGRYTGDGACNKTVMSDGRLYPYLAYLLTAEPGNIFYLYYLHEFLSRNIRQSPRGLTLVDDASRDHDRDGPDFMNFKSTQANNKWIKSASSNFVGNLLLGPLPTDRAWRKTYKREYESLPDWIRRSDLGNTAATINAAGTLYVDYHVAVIGTVLFGSVNNLNYLGHAIDKTARKFGAWSEQALSPSGGINARATFSLDFGMQGRLRWDMSIRIPKGRFKNIGNVQKWRL